MSDTLTNALAQAGRSSTVLQGIANPATVNPLAGMGTTMEMVGRMQGLDKSLSEQSLGQAYQQAVDPKTGRFDPLKFNQLAAADPRTAYAMRTGIESSQNLQGSQLDQNIKMNAQANAALTAALAGDDAGLKGRLLEQAQRLIDAGFPRDRVMAGLMNFDGSDPAKLRQQLMTIHTQTLPVEEREKILSGTMQPVSAGGSTQIIPVPSARSGVTVNVPHTATVGEQTGFVSVPVPLDADGNVTTPDKAVRYEQRQVQRSSLGGMPLPGTPGARPTYNAPGASPQGGGSPPAPPAPGVRLGTGYQARPGAAPATAGAPGPLVPAAPSAPPPVPATATPPAPPAVPGVTTGPGNTPVIGGIPQGQPEELKANQEAYRAAQEAQPGVQTRAQNMAHAYEALKQLQSATGKGAPGLSGLRSFAVSMGIAGAATVKEQQLVDLVTKYTEKAMIDAAGGSSTDMGRRMAEQSNAGLTITTPANFDVLRNDMGKAMQQAAAYVTHDGKAGGAGFKKHAADVANTTDPLGFVWSTLPPEEQARIRASVAKDKVAREKLATAMGMVDAHPELRITGLTGAPRPRPGSGY